MYHRSADLESRIGVWTLRLGVALFFALAGLEKFSSAPASQWVVLFRAIGLGSWFRYFTGVVEILGGLLFLVPPATASGTALLSATMLGAVIVHVHFRHFGNAVVPAVLLIAVIGIGLAVQPDRNLHLQRRRKLAS